MEVARYNKSGGNGSRGFREAVRIVAVGYWSVGGGTRKLFPREPLKPLGSSFTPKSSLRWESISLSRPYKYSYSFISIHSIHLPSIGDII